MGERDYLGLALTHPQGWETRQPQTKLSVVSKGGMGTQPVWPESQDGGAWSASFLICILGHIVHHAAYQGFLMIYLFI